MGGGLCGFFFFLLTGSNEMVVCAVFLLWNAKKSTLRDLNLCSEGLYHIISIYILLPFDRLIGLVVRCPPRERKIPGSNPACTKIFPGSSHQ